MIVWRDIYSALALVLVIEGIMPFLRPDKWRSVMSMASKQPEHTLRFFGLVSMLVGTMLLYYFRQQL